MGRNHVPKFLTFQHRTHVRGVLSQLDPYGRMQKKKNHHKTSGEPNASEPSIVDRDLESHLGGGELKYKMPQQSEDPAPATYPPVQNRSPFVILSDASTTIPDKTLRERLQKMDNEMAEKQ